MSDPVTQGANQNQFGDCPETTLETRLQLRPLFLSAFSILSFIPLSLQLIDRGPTVWQWRIWSIPKVRRGGCRCRTDCIVYTSGCVVGHPTAAQRELHTPAAYAKATAYGEHIRAYRLLVVGCFTDGPVVVWRSVGVDSVAQIPHFWPPCVSALETTLSDELFAALMDIQPHNAVASTRRRSVHRYR